MQQALAGALAQERLRIVASLIRVTGDWDLAEDCLQDAGERALVRWPRDGTPDNPAAWLTTTAHRRALDVLRRRRTEADKVREVAVLAEREPPVAAGPGLDRLGGVFGDDRLRLLFTCCHPALPLGGRVALTLKTVAGLSTSQIARAFLVSEATMGQRLLRTKTKIKNAGIRLRVPEPHRLPERIAGVLAVVYLIFNEGYQLRGEDGVGGGIHGDLAGEAVRLAALLAHLLPQDDEVHGLNALLLFQHARRSTRRDAAGDLVPMEEQDRSRWDHAMLAAGLVSLDAARACGSSPGPYRLQAEIAALHATAPSPELTDWNRIVVGFDALMARYPSPIVALNLAVARGFRDGPQAGLEALAEVEGDPRLAGYHLLPAVRADLLRRAGRGPDAAASYQEALRLVATEAERRFLERRLSEVSDSD